MFLTRRRAKYLHGWLFSDLCSVLASVCYPQFSLLLLPTRVCRFQKGVACIPFLDIFLLNLIVLLVVGVVFLRDLRLACSGTSLICLRSSVRVYSDDSRWLYVGCIELMPFADETPSAFSVLSHCDIDFWRTDLKIHMIEVLPINQPSFTEIRLTIHVLEKIAYNRFAKIFPRDIDL